MGNLYLTSWEPLNLQEACKRPQTLQGKASARNSVLNKCGNTPKVKKLILESLCSTKVFSEITAASLQATSALH